MSVCQFSIHCTVILQLSGKLKKQLFCFFSFLSRNDLEEFITVVKDDLPDKSLFKEMGTGNIVVNDLYNLLIKSFGLNVSE